VINWSGFVSDPSPEALAELKAAIEYAGRKNVLLVAGAGNSGLNVDLPENATYPVCFPKVACGGMINAYASLRAASR
jgi:subtilisin family serine protease